MRFCRNNRGDVLYEVVRYEGGLTIQRDVLIEKSSLNEIVTVLAKLYAYLDLL